MAKNITTKKATAACRIHGRAFRINDRDAFLYSGEVHYFRIPRRYWPAHLEALVDAGCNAVSTYVPWSWHEFKERQTDLTGRTHSERDLVGFLDLAREMDLFVTLKPGPYVMAEITDQGIPAWLTENYPDTMCLDENGNPWGPDSVSYADPVFRAKAANWLRKFARDIVVPRQPRKRGAVILLQLCNEIGMFQWLGARGDFSAATTAAWHAYLRSRFRKVADLAALLERETDDFREVMPPSEFCSSKGDSLLYRLWHDFHRCLYADYVGFLHDTLRNEGVATPLFTNVGGWVFGRAHEFPLNATFHRETTKAHRDVFYGIDHIPEYVSPLNSHDGIVATQVVDEMQRRRKPLYSAELQCGSREHGVQPYPRELALFYRQCLIHGLTGMNFYMFSQGRNPKGRGYDGPMFYWYNAVNYKGARQEVYPVIKELGEWIKQNGKLLARARRPAGLAVALYPPLYETEFLYPKLQNKKNADPGSLGITNPVLFRDKAYFDGVIRILVEGNVPYDLADITVRSTRDLLSYQSLVVLSNESMDAETQTKLLDYVRSGGCLTIFPMLPKCDLEFRPCGILQEGLGIHLKGQASSRRVYMARLKDIPVAGAPLILHARGGKRLAETANKETVGVEKKVGKGTVRCFGFHLHYTIEEHPRLWSAMMKLPEIERNAWADNDDLQVEARFAGREAILFVGNFHRAPRKARIKVRGPHGEEPIDLGTIELEGLTGLLLPINRRLGNGLTLVYAHGELVDVKAGANGARIKLRGPLGSKGHIAIRSRKTIRGITVDGQSVSMKTIRNMIHAEYGQTGSSQVIDFSYNGG